MVLQAYELLVTVYFKMLLKVFCMEDIKWKDVPLYFHKVLCYENKVLLENAALQLANAALQITCISNFKF